MSLIVGVDPGLSGAIAFLNDEGVLEIVDMPVLVTKKGAKKQSNIDTCQLANEIDSRNKLSITHAYIEAVHAMPGQGVTSCFQFGKGFGIVIGVIAANYIPFTLVTPNEWKKTLRVPAEKDGARARASELMPRFSHLWSLKKHDGRAEAALLAYWGRQSLANGI